ncbi:MAG TPA: response regulator transcription factor [Balneolales bacterium]|nr:response regulator transcription factor [Balneolales bacterium]
MTTTDTLPVLLIEDDPDIRDLLEINLQDIGVTLDTSADGLSGLHKAVSNNYRLIILDVMLPGMDGIEICRRLRAREIHTPLLMLTAKSQELDRVLGLEIGADDYLTKPFSIRELQARIKALLRRANLSNPVNEIPSAQDKIVLGELHIDTVKRKVTLNNELISLTAKELELLELFARNPGRTFTRQELLNEVWGYQFEGYDHTVNSHINRLRTKIEEDPSQPVYLKTVWGIGYRFTEPEELKT